MADTGIKSGPEIVKEFVESLEKDKSLDKDTIEVITLLYIGNKLTQTRLLQGLEEKRKESEKKGVREEWLG